MNQYQQQPIDPNAGMQQLQSSLESKPIKVDELQVKKMMEQPQQQQQRGGGGAEKLMQAAMSYWG